MVSGKARLIANEIIELYQNHGESAQESGQVTQFEHLMQLAQTAPTRKRAVRPLKPLTR